MTRGFELQQVLEAIKGSGGITLAVSTALDCDWKTADKYIKKWETTKTAFEAEGERVLDVAESVVQRNIQLAYRKQTETKQPVDTGDAKWLLSRKGKARGYADKQEIDLQGENDITIRVVYTDDGTDDNTPETA